MSYAVRALTALCAMALLAGALTSAVSAVSPGGPPAIPPGLGNPAFNNSSGEIVGSFVRLQAPDAGDIIENFESDGILFFDSIAVSGYEKHDQIFVGSLLKLKGAGAEAQVHDNPNTIIKLTLAPNGTADFDLADGVTAASSGNHSFRLSVSGGNRTASVWWACENGTVTVADDNASFSATAPNNSCIVFFRAHIEMPPSEAAVSEAAVNGMLAAEVFAGREAKDGADVTTYGAASAVVAHAPGRIVVTVNTFSDGPASVLVRFVPGETGPDQVTVDGRPAAPSAGLEDALDASDDTHAEYSVTSQGENALLVVALPQGGAHVIEIQDFAVTPVRDLSAPFVGAALGLVFAAVAAVLLLRRR